MYWNWNSAPWMMPVPPTALVVTIPWKSLWCTLLGPLHLGGLVERFLKTMSERGLKRLEFPVKTGMSLTTSDLSVLSAGAQERFWSPYLKVLSNSWAFLMKMNNPDGSVGPRLLRTCLVLDTLFPWICYTIDYWSLLWYCDDKLRITYINL